MAAQHELPYYALPARLVLWKTFALDPVTKIKESSSVWLKKKENTQRKHPHSQPQRNTRKHTHTHKGCAVQTLLCKAEEIYRIWTPEEGANRGGKSIFTLKHEMTREARAWFKIQLENLRDALIASLRILCHLRLNCSSFHHTTEAKRVVQTPFLPLPFATHSSPPFTTLHSGCVPP